MLFSPVTLTLLTNSSGACADLKICVSHAYIKVIGCLDIDFAQLCQHPYSQRCFGIQTYLEIIYVYTLCYGIGINVMA